MDSMVDSMATFMIVNSRRLLYRVTNSNPQCTVVTADGLKKVDAIGTVLAHFLVDEGGGERWRCYEIQEVYLMTACPDILY